MADELSAGALGVAFVEVRADLKKLGPDLAAAETQVDVSTKRIGQSAGNVAREMATSVGGAMRDVGTQAKTGFDGVASAAAKSADTIADRYDRAIAELDQILDRFGSKAGTAFGTIGTQAEAGIESAAQATSVLGGVMATTTAAVGTLGSTMGAVLVGVAPWIPLAIAVGEAISYVATSSADAALAAETAAAKQDVVNRAFALSGQVLTYADAVKYLNEQFRNTNPLADHAADALEHVNVAIKNGPLNASLESTRLLQKAQDDVRKVFQEDTAKMGGMSGMLQGLDLLRQGTVESDIAFAQWAKDLGLSSTTIALLRDQVRAETDAQKNAEQATKKHSDELTRQADAEQKILEQRQKAKDALVAHLMGADDIDKANEYLQAADRVGDLTRLTTAAQKELNAALQRGLDAYHALGLEAPADMLRVWAATAQPPNLRGGQGLESIGTAAPLIAPALAPRELQQIGALSGMHVGTSFASELRATLTGELQDFPSVLEHALVSGHGLDSALEGFGARLGGSFSKAMLDAITADMAHTQLTTDAQGRLTVTRGSGVTGRMLEYAGATGAVAGVGIALNGGSARQQLGGLASAGLGTGLSAGMTAGSLSAGLAAGAVSFGVGAAVVGGVALIKHLHQSEWEKLGKDIGRDIGVQIPQEMLKAWESESKQFGRQATEILHLNDLIQAAGGLSPSNLDQFTHLLHDTFSMIETGQLSVAQGTQVLDQNFNAFVTAATDGAGRVSAQLKEIVALDERFGTHSQAIAAWKQAQGATALSSFSSSIDAGQLTDQPSLQAASTRALGTYATAVATGMSPQDALDQIGPALQTIKQAYADLGLEIDDVGLKQLILQSTIQQTAAPAVAAISSVSKEMIALDNLGLETPEMFKAQQVSAIYAYDKIQGAAVAASSSFEEGIRSGLAQMQTYLHQAEEEAQRLGVPLDENTQRLIDQSKELGIWKEGAKSDTQIVTEGMKTLVDTVQDLIDTLRGVPRRVDTDVNVTTRHLDVYEGPPPPPDDLPITDDPTAGLDVIPAAKGGAFRVAEPTLFLVGEDGTEDALFSGGRQTLSDRMSIASAPTEKAGDTYNVYIDAVDAYSFRDLMRREGVGVLVDQLAKGKRGYDVAARAGMGSLT